jgi:hypothetical protein
MLTMVTGVLQTLLTLETILLYYLLYYYILL